MEVILLEHVNKLGGVGDLVRVKDGYARNYLLPFGKALRATNENKERFESERAKILKDNESKKSAASSVAKKIEGQFVVLSRQAGEDGRLYGSVTAKDIAGALSSLGEAIGKEMVQLSQAIKYLGVYKLQVFVHPEISVETFVNVARNEEEAEEAKKEFLNPVEKKKEEPQEEVVAEEVVEETQEPVAEPETSVASE